MKEIILASSSPRRKELLEQLGIEFSVDAGEKKEEVHLKMDPHELTRFISRKKAEAVAPRHKDAIIISADTIGVLDGKILGKPQNPAGAKRMLREMSGKPHRVITGYTIVDTAIGKMVSNSVETIVYIKTLSDSEIDAYVATGETLDKAGAYGIQGRGAIIVKRIEGDYFNVVGLPLFFLAETLKEFGVTII